MNDAPAEFFRARVLEWSVEHRRAFPWRERRDPYAVLMAEMMLRRTRADQVTPVFCRFLERFPDPHALTVASEAKVSEVLRPLGLSWRVPAFRKVAAAIVHSFGGSVPASQAELKALPGVGDYVSAAVRIFAFDQPATLADTNTVRVAARYFGFPYHAESRRRSTVRRHVDRLVDARHPRTSASALLDLAALVCQARRPLCDRCPVQALCATRLATSIVGD